MMKRTNFIITRLNPENGALYSYAESCPACADMWSLMQSVPNILHAFAVSSERQARETAEHWNNTYKGRGDYWEDGDKMIEIEKRELEFHKAKV